MDCLAVTEGHQGSEAQGSDFVHLAPSSSAAVVNNSGGPAEASEQSLGGRSIAAYLSEEEDSADSSTDSDDRENALSSAFSSILNSSTSAQCPVDTADASQQAVQPALAGGSALQPKHMQPLDNFTDS